MQGPNLSGGSALRVRGTSVRCHWLRQVVLLCASGCGLFFPTDELPIGGGGATTTTPTGGSGPGAGAAGAGATGGMGGTAGSGTGGAAAGGAGAGGSWGAGAAPCAEPAMPICEPQSPSGPCVEPPPDFDLAVGLGLARELALAIKDGELHAFVTQDAKGTHAAQITELNLTNNLMPVPALTLLGAAEARGVAVYSAGIPADSRLVGSFFVDDALDNGAVTMVPLSGGQPGPVREISTSLHGIHVAITSVASGSVPYYFLGNTNGTVNQDFLNRPVPEQPEPAGCNPTGADLGHLDWCVGASSCEGCEPAPPLQKPINPTNGVCQVAVNEGAAGPNPIRSITSVGDTLFYAASCPSGFGCVRKMTVVSSASETCGPTSPVPNLNDPFVFDLWADQNWIVYSTRPGSNTDPDTGQVDPNFGTIAAYKRTGGEARTVLARVRSPAHVTVLANIVYFTVSATRDEPVTGTDCVTTNTVKGIYGVRLDEAQTVKPTLVAEALPNGRPWAVASDPASNTIYWIEQGMNGAPSVLRSVPGGPYSSP